jgi:glycosyltransferase involved in cell wall biosynthesis
MKILCLLDDIVKPGDRWLWKYLPSNNDEIDFLVTTGAVDRFQKWGKLFNYYPAYWQSGLQALLKTRQTPYDLVVAWEGKNGFPYAMLRSVFGQKSPPFLVVAFNYRGLVRHFGVLARFAMRSVTHTTVTTTFEEKYYQQVLALKPNAISWSPLGWYDPLAWYDPRSVQLPDFLSGKDRFILSSGRSYRDYATLANAVRGLDMKVIIIAREFNLAGVDLPDNVITTDLLPMPKFRALLHQAEFVVLPMHNLPHAVGDTHLIQIMSFGKAVIATRVPSSETYVEPGRTGMIVSPGDVTGMRQAILHLWQNPNEAVRMGKEARTRFEEHYTIDKLAQRIYGVALEVYRAQGE